ncbi:hypothetical protein [Pseudoduganella sp. OTU4001]|uniref:hypothetical protein n=1 Tax=Pseudoduganella sp. OTU4001 TaxID=3043854 RepID=UPI00313C157C
MYPLLEFYRDGQHLGTVRQGSQSLLRFRHAAHCRDFLEQLLAARRTSFHVDGIDCRLKVAPGLFGLLSATPTVLGGLSLRDNLGLAVPQEPADLLDARIAHARTVTGLLAGIELARRTDSLDWRQRLELNLLQVWLRAPDCLLCERLLDGGRGSALEGLPALFRQRYPLRAVCYVQHGPARLPPGLATVIEL